MSLQLENCQDEYTIPDTLNNDLDISNILNAENSETLFSPEKCFSINLAESIWRPKFKKKDAFLNSDSNDLAAKVLEYRQNLLNVKKDRINQLKSYLNDKVSNGHLLTDNEEYYYLQDIKSTVGIEEKYLDKFLDINEAEHKEISLESIVDKVNKAGQEFSFSDLDLREILVQINGRNQPSKKIADELTKAVKKTSTKTDSKQQTLDISLIRSFPGLFNLLRHILVKHEMKRSEAKAANANSRIPSLTIPNVIEKVHQWQSNEESKRLNVSWINKTNDWRVYVEPALRFLTADPAIDILSDKENSPNCSRPFVEFKNRTQNCTWITVMNKNYDDEIATEERKRLLRMFPEWFKFANRYHKYLQTLLVNSKMKPKTEQNNSSSKTASSKKSSKSSIQNAKPTVEVNTEEDIPPCSCPTDWTVRPSNNEEKLEFQKQESERFSKPWMPYVYHQHGYMSIVGPLRSYLRQSDPNSIAGMKPRSHPLLRNDRPSIVGLADIVRDAVARLPNGEGTRNDIVTLAMDSSFFISKFDEKQLHQCISGALDRLQCEPDTPVVYRQSRRVWIYKHRHRTSDDFMEIYQTQKDIQAKKKELKRNRPQSGHVFENLENSKIRRISSDISTTRESINDNLPSRRVYKSNKVSKVYSNSTYDNMQDDIPDIDDLLNSNDPDLDSCRSSSRTSLTNTYENYSNNMQSSSSYSRNNYSYSSLHSGSSNLDKWPHSSNVLPINGSGMNTNGFYHRNGITPTSSSNTATTVRVQRTTPSNITTTIRLQKPPSVTSSSGGNQQPMQFTRVKTITIPNNKSNTKTVTPVYIRKLTK